MDITLSINGLSLSERLSTYAVVHEVSYRKVIKTLDNVEHAYPGEMRPIITFSLLPMTEAQEQELYYALAGFVVDVTYTDKGMITTRKMRLDSDIESVFLLTSVDGLRRYKGGKIQLRGV